MFAIVSGALTFGPALPGAGAVVGFVADQLLLTPFLALVVLGFVIVVEGG
jgi:hypothetical protein